MAAFEAELPPGLGGPGEYRYSVEARYAYQVWDIPIALEGEGVADEAQLERLVESFHDAHERIFAVREPGQTVEMNQWKGRVTVTTEKPPVAARRDGAVAGDGVRRIAFLPELGEVEIPVHRGAELGPESSVEGPALVIEPETTIVVYPGWTAHVTDLGNYRLEFA